jgi:hypothetical protein
MVLIRPEQVTVFEAAALRNFEDRMVEYLPQFAPRHFKILTEDDIRRIIRFGREKASSHDLILDRSMRLYVEMMILLGSGFDTDPQMPWAEEILTDESMVGEALRIDRLYHMAWDYADHVRKDYRDLTGSVDPEQFVEQIRELHRESVEVLKESEIPQFSEQFLARLRQNFLHKFNYVGEQALRRLISQSMRLAREYNITTERGIAVYLSIMSVFGAGFDKDPQVPWAAAILTDSTISSQNKRAEKLLAAGVECLHRWWA